MEDIKTLIHGDATSDQIKAIDQLVYRLYSLTLEEIVIIEERKES